MEQQSKLGDLAGALPGQTISSDVASGYRDFEVVGRDTDGCVLQWDAGTQTIYNCGETPEQFGMNNLTADERKRVTEVA